MSLSRGHRASRPGRRPAGGVPRAWRRRPRDVTISGVVYEVTPSGEVPIEGVRIANGGGAPVLTETDGNGFFSFRPVRVCPCWSSPSIPAGTTLLFIEKNGYDDPPGLPESAFRPHGPGFRDVMIDGDTRVRIQLVRR